MARGGGNMGGAGKPKGWPFARAEKPSTLSEVDRTFVEKAEAILKMRGERVVSREKVGAFRTFMLASFGPAAKERIVSDLVEKNTISDDTLRGLTDAFDSFERGEQPPVVQTVLTSTALPREKPKSKAPVTALQEKKRAAGKKGKERLSTAHLTDVEFFATLHKDPTKWSADESDEIQRRLSTIREHLTPQIAALQGEVQGTLRKGEAGENVLLNEYAKLFSEASTVKNAPLNVKMERFLYFSKQIIHLGLKKEVHYEHLSKTSPHTEAVARLMAAKQQELEREGSPIPQPTTMDPLSFKLGDIADLGHRIASGAISTTVVAVEVGTITTMVLLLAQEMFGLFIQPWSPLHKALLATVALVLAPVIEYAKGLYFTKPAERKERKERKEKDGYFGRVQASVGKHMRVGVLALLAGTGVAGVSKFVQGMTLEVGVAMGGDSSELAEQSTQAKTQVLGETGLERFGVVPLTAAQEQAILHGGEVPRIAISSGPIHEAINNTGTITESILNNEWIGHHVEGQGGREGAEGQGPALAYKAGLLIGGWRPDAWGGPLPESGPIRDAYERGMAARRELGLVVEVPGQNGQEPTEANLTLQGGLAALWSEFIDVVPEASEGDPHPISTRDHMQALVEDMEELGIDVSQIPDAGRLDEYKWRLATAQLWPGKPVIYRVRDEALAHIAVIESRYVAFRTRATELTSGASTALESEAERMHRSEGPMAIEFPQVRFDTDMLRQIHIDHSVSISELPEAHARAAEVITGGNGWLNILASGLLLYGLASIGVGAIAYGKGRMNRKRYMDFLEKFREEYPVTTDNKEGYLDKLSGKMTEGMQALFTSDVGFFGKDTMRQLTALLGDKPWARVDEEMLQVAFAEVMSELSEVEALDAMSALEGIVHMYSEGFADIFNRGNPEELKALNAAHRLLNSQSEFSRRLIEKLFPGFYSLEEWLATKSTEQSEDGPSRKEAMKFDGVLYGVVLQHLEQRVRIEKTKLAWCTQAFDEFRSDNTFEKLGIGTLTEEPNEASISLKAVNSFAETPLKPEKLAGSALRQAAIRTLKGKIDNANQQLSEIELLLNNLDESLTVKAGKLGALDDGIYKKIEKVRSDVLEAKAFDPHAESAISQLTPQGKISSVLADASVAEIAQRMGTTVDAARAAETPEQLRERIESQFNTLIRVANTKWSWEKIFEKDKVRMLQKQSIDNGAYDMRAEFVVNPANETTPAASYGVKFSIDYKGTGANDPPEEVVNISYSLSTSFSEHQTPAEILDFFRDHIDDRGNYYAARVFAHRIQKGLLKERSYDQPKNQKPFELTSKSVDDGLRSYGEYLKHDSIQRHRDSLRGRLEARKKLMPASADATVSGTNQIRPRASSEWRAVDEELKALCDEVESLTHPAISAPIAQNQMRLIVNSLRGSEYVRRSNIKVLYDHEKDKVTVTNPGIIGFGKKSAEVSISTFKTTFENQGGSAERAVKVLLAQNDTRNNRPTRGTGRRTASSTERSQRRAA